MDPFIVKFSYGDEIVRLKLDLPGKSHPAEGVAVIDSTVRAEYDIPASTSLKYLYQDADGDLCTLKGSTYEDFLAHATGGEAYTLKLLVRVAQTNAQEAKAPKDAGLEKFEEAEPDHDWSLIQVAEVQNKPMQAVTPDYLGLGSAKSKRFNVCVLGMAGGIGQPLTMLLKMNPRVKQLTGFDIAPFTPGVGVDLSHIDSDSTCIGYFAPPGSGDEELYKSLEGADVVLIPAGVPRKPGMTRDDLFNVNAGIVKNLVAAVAKVAPTACILIISNPVNSTVAIAAEVLKTRGVYDPRKLMGVTSLDISRSRTFVANLKGLDPAKVNVPVVGGHAGTTIVPLLSQTSPKVTFTDEERDALTKRIMFGGDEVVQAKDGAGSATLSMAYAAAVFADAVMMGLSGKKQEQCTFVDSSITPGLDDRSEAKFFSSVCTLGPDGVEKVHKIGNITKHEQELIDDMLPTLIEQGKKGAKWAEENDCPGI